MTSPTRQLTIAGKLAYRAYLLTMRWESMLSVKLRARLASIMLRKPSANLNIFADVFLEGVHGLTLGDDVSINRASNLSAGGGLTVGNNVSIGHNTSIITNNHGFGRADMPIIYRPTVADPVVIGDDVWIGAKVCILPGVTIAPGTVVAAGSVVTRSVEEPNTVVGGVPARLIKRRFN